MGTAQKQWMIYGANGYTGELIAREARQRLVLHMRVSLKDMFHSSLHITRAVTIREQTPSLYWPSQVTRVTKTVALQKS